MNRLLVLDSDYPNENNLGDAFVHTRLKRYLERSHVLVAGLSDSLPQQYTYEGIEVRNFRLRSEYVDFVVGYKPDVLLIHFFQGWMLKPIVFGTQVPIVIWVHGGEALGWYRRMFKYSLSLRSVGKLLFDIPTITRQMYRWNKLIAYANRTERVTLVFVSQWMKRIFERDSLSRVLYSEVIPNPIDTELFAYNRKTPEHRKRILVLRSFATKKYAGDVVVQAILELSRRDFFGDLEFYIRGWGALFDELTLPLRQFGNVHLHKGFVEQRTIPSIHRDYGVFLCPTRQDAQGVSMCEAMSSGLVPIASANTAIPEFVTDSQTGFLTGSFREIADRVEFLYRNPDKFQLMSEQASTSVRKISGADYVTAQEIAVIETMATASSRSDEMHHIDNAANAEW